MSPLKASFSKNGPLEKRQSLAVGRKGANKKAQTQNLNKTAEYLGMQAQLERGQS